MNSAISASQSQKSTSGASPFDQIAALELREKERLEIEIAGMQREKDEVFASVQKKEEQATEELKVKAKQELKQYSESELSKILTDAQKEAEADCEHIAAKAKAAEKDALAELLTLAKDPTSYFPATAA